jgi:hypothetical protein
MSWERPNPTKKLAGTISREVGVSGTGKIVTVTLPALGP